MRWIRFVDPDDVVNASTPLCLGLIALGKMEDEGVSLCSFMPIRVLFFFFVSFFYYCVSDGMAFDTKGMFGTSLLGDETRVVLHTLNITNGACKHVMH